MQGLVATLRTHGATSPSITCAASGALAAAASASPVCATGVATAGGVSALVDVVRSSLSVSPVAAEFGFGLGRVGDAMSAACRALAEKSIHEDSVACLADRGVLEALVGVLSVVASTSAAVFASSPAYAALPALDVTDGVGAATLSATPLAPSLSMSVSCWTAAAHAARAIANIAVDDDALAYFIEAAGAPLLVVLLEAGLRGSPSDCEDAAAATAAATDANASAAAAVMATHIAEAMCTLSATASGAAALFDAGAIPPLLQAITVPISASGVGDATGSARFSSKRQLVLWDAVCWTLRGFARNREQLRALAAAGATATLTAPLLQLQWQASPQAATEASAIAHRVVEHARALFEALRL